MFDKIDQIKPQYIYSVQPVKFFDEENIRPKYKNSPAYPNLNKTSGYNHFHPDISNSEKGEKIDILG